MDRATDDGQPVLQPPPGTDGGGGQDPPGAGPGCDYGPGREGHRNDEERGGGVHADGVVADSFGLTDSPEEERANGQARQRYIQEPGNHEANGQTVMSTPGRGIDALRPGRPSGTPPGWGSKLKAMGGVIGLRAASGTPERGTEGCMHMARNRGGGPDEKERKEAEDGPNGKGRKKQGRSRAGASRPCSPPTRVASYARGRWQAHARE